MKHYLLIVLAILAAVAVFLAGYFAGQRSFETGPPQTVVRIDTVFYQKPEPVRVLPSTFVSVRVPRVIFAPASTTTSIIANNVDSLDSYVDSLDSVDVQVAVERKQYGDSTYRAQVSGPALGDLHPALDWVEVYNRTTTHTQTITKRSRFAVTVGAGIAYTPQGFQTYIGAGVGVVVWQW